MCTLTPIVAGVNVSATRESLHVRFSPGDPHDDWQLIYCFTLTFPTAGYHHVGGCFTLPVVAGPRLALWLAKHFGPLASSWETYELHSCMS